MKYMVGFTAYAPGNEPVPRTLYLGEIERFNDREGLKKYIYKFCERFNRGALNCDEDIDISFNEGYIDHKVNFLDVSDHFGIKEGGFIFGLGSLFERLIIEKRPILTMLNNHN